MDESRAFAFVAYENPEHAAAALAHFQAQDDGLRVVKCMKREERLEFLRKEHLKAMRDLARNNLYFKGFPCDDCSSVEDLQNELKNFFEKFGEVKTLRVMHKRVAQDEEVKEKLFGFGFVSFQTLESAQKCRYDV